MALVEFYIKTIINLLAKCWLSSQWFNFLFPCCCSILFVFGRISFELDCISTPSIYRFRCLLCGDYWCLFGIRLTELDRNDWWKMPWTTMACYTSIIRIQHRLPSFISGSRSKRRKIESIMKRYIIIIIIIEYKFPCNAIDIEYFLIILIDISNRFVRVCLSSS